MENWWFLGQKRLKDGHKRLESTQTVINCMKTEVSSIKITILEKYFLKKSEKNNFDRGDPMKTLDLRAPKNRELRSP